MVMSPEAIQKQLSDAVSIIGRYDFPAKWPNLISQMVDKFGTGLFFIRSFFSLKIFFVSFF